MGTMNVSLPDDLIDFVRQEVDSGGYGNNSDVVRDALRRLREQREQRAVLKQLINVGREQLAAGKGVALTDEVIDEIASRAKRRGQSERGGTA